MSIGRLTIDFGDISEGSSVSARGSGCETLDDSPGLEVLALLARGRRNELSGCEAVIPGVVVALLVSYLCCGAEKTGSAGGPPSEVESVGPLWPEMGNGEHPKKRRLSASECESTKGQ